MMLKQSFLTTACGFLLLSCGDTNFSGSKASTNAPRGLDGTAAAEVGSIYGTNPDGSPKLGPYAVTDTSQLSTGIDLIIALDTSGSMREESVAVQANLKQTIATLQASSLDPIIHMIASGGAFAETTAATVFPADVDPNRLAWVDSKVDSHNALSQIMSLLKGELAAFYKDVKGSALAAPIALRAGTKLELLVISDDDGLNAMPPRAPYSNLAKDFDPEKKWKSTVSAIVGIPGSAEAANVCKIANIGQEYITLVTQTQGSLLDICTKDWKILIDRFSQDIVKRSASLVLSQKPIDPAKLVVSLDAKELAPDQWSYNASENRLILAATVVFKAGSVLGVNYDAAPSP